MDKDSKSPTPLVLPDFARQIAETAEIVDLAGTKRSQIARSIQHSLTLMQKILLREQAEPLLDHKPSGFLMTCLTAEAAEIIRLVFKDARKQFPHFKLQDWEKHPYKPAWRMQFLNRHWVTLSIVPGINAKTPHYGIWQLGGKA